MSAEPIQSVPAASLEVNDYEMSRGTRRALSLLSGKWSVEIVYLLANGTRRYSDVLYEVGEISKKTLTQTLRALERDGILARKVYAQVPPRVEYTLTPLGRSLAEPIGVIQDWAEEHVSGVLQAREDYDATLA
jgi:DNA-binding HxlR family transcriptional regulator